MTRKASALALVLLAAVGLWPKAPAGPSAEVAEAGRTVYLGTGLNDEDTLVLSSAVAAADPRALVLLDGPKVAKPAARFLSALRPKAVIPVGNTGGDAEELAAKFDAKLAPVLAWKNGVSEAMWASLFPQAPRVVVVPAESRRLLLHATCLAGALRAPLFVLRGADRETESLRQ